jgi:type I restriction enzyme, S subunit
MDSTILQPTGNYPDDWVRTDCDHFATLQRGKDLTRDHFRTGSVPVAGSNGIIGYHDTANVRAPGITVGRSGSVGKVTFYQQDFWAHNTALFVKDFHGNVPAFVAFFLDFLRLGRFGSGASVPTLDRNVFRTLPIVIPPSCEQRKIAAVLGLVQRAIEQQERLIALTTELKKALIHKVFTEGLRGETQKQTEIGPVPESWEVAPLKTLLSEPLRNGHSAKASGSGEGVRTLTLTAVTRRDFSVQNTKLTVADPHRVRDMWLRTGDILVERANTFEYVGLAALYDGPSDFAIYPDLMIRVRVDENRIRPKFLTDFLITPGCRLYFQKQARSTAGNFPKIDQGTVEQTLISFPSAEEQDNIVSLLMEVDRKENFHYRKHSALTDLFRVLLHQLMTAQIRVENLEISELQQLIDEQDAARSSLDGRS